MLLYLFQDIWGMASYAYFTANFLGLFSMSEVSGPSVGTSTQCQSDRLKWKYFCFTGC